MLIETHRAEGNKAKAEQLMQRYIDRFPTERSANKYRRVLGHQAE
jgi:hypothetical protein